MIRLMKNIRTWFKRMCCGLTGHQYRPVNCYRRFKNGRGALVILEECDQCGHSHELKGY